MLKKLAVSALILSASSAFAFGWDKMEGVTKAQKSGVFTAAAEWVKDKDDKYDVSFKLTNDTEKTILLFVGDMKCARGAKHDGTLDNHSDNRTIDLRPKESRSVVFTCRGMDEKQKGDFTVNFKVFENPTGDSKTPGKVLADNLVWKQGATEGKIMK
jgi:hypothetical protein